MDNALAGDFSRTARAAGYEIAVIGSMLLDERCIGPVLAELTEDHFVHASYRRLFSAMRKMHLDSKPVDPVTVCGELGDNSQELVDLMRQCLEVTPTAANAGEYARLLRAEARRLHRQDLGAQLAAEPDPEKQDALVEKLVSLDVDRRVRAVSASEAAQDFLERIRERKKPEYLPWGIPSLDRILEVEPGDDIVLGGYSSAGKTLLAIQFAMVQAKKYRVGYYSLETSTRKLVDRAIAGLSGVSLGDIKRMSFDDQDLFKLTSAAVQYADYNLDHIDGSWIHSAEDIIATALSRHHQIIYIDYLQLLVPPDSYKIYNAVTALSRTMHRAAQAHGITVVLLSQLRRPDEVKGKGAVQPNMNSFKESGQIEYDADAAMLLYLSDPKDYMSPRVLSIAKNKDGPRGQVFLEFDGPHMTMRECRENKSREIAAALSAAGRAAKQSNQIKSRQMQFTPLTSDDPDMPF